jgi:histidinol-phosphatase (PHP family)
MVIDSHVHTLLSGHATGTAPEIASSARERGVSVLTFTEHMPLPRGWDPDREYALTREELPEYLAQVAEASALEGIEVLLGAEVDWLPGFPEHMADAISAAEFDLVLGSVHFLGRWAFDDPRLIERYENLAIEDVWTEYFDAFAAASASGLFDVMAHPDLVKKFGFYPEAELSAWYEPAVTALSRGGMAIEVSTGGLRKPCGEMYPSPLLLGMCAEAGIPATISSDAHSPEEVGWGYDRAVDALKTAGYDSIVYFRSREPVEVELA